jgi:hypothetical protein
MAPKFVSSGEGQIAQDTRARKEFHVPWNETRVRQGVCKALPLLHCVQLYHLECIVSLVNDWYNVTYGERVYSMLGKLVSDVSMASTFRTG